ncbi:MAG: hypothetical protein KF752_01030 [Pirellulaceae bacterium]|nr:hypothetical protein [Pirellulaceae bacterium]
MAINPLVATLGIPLAAQVALPVARAAGKGVQHVGQTFSELLGGLGSASESAAESQGSISLTFGQKLSAVADELRGWLETQGVSSPFAIEIRSGGHDFVNSQQLNIQGPQRDRIEQLLQANEPLLNKLRQLIDDASSATTLGASPTSVTITDSHAMVNS